MIIVKFDSDGAMLRMRQKTRAFRSVILINIQSVLTGKWWSFRKKCVNLRRFF